MANVILYCDKILIIAVYDDSVIDRLTNEGTVVFLNI